MDNRKAINLIKRTMPKGNSALEIMMKDALEISMHTIEELEKYQALGTYEQVREAVERCRAKKVETIIENVRGTEYEYLCCPACKELICGEWDRKNYLRFVNFCLHCGQKLDWSVEE